MRVPDQNLVSSATRGRDNSLSPDLRIATRDKQGQWAMVYTTRGSLIRVRMDSLKRGTAMAYWCNPRSGRWDAGAGDKIGFIR